MAGLREGTRQPVLPPELVSGRNEHCRRADVRERTGCQSSSISGIWPSRRDGSGVVPRRASVASKTLEVVAPVWYWTSARPPRVILLENCRVSPPRTMVPASRTGRVGPWSQRSSFVWLCVPAHLRFAVAARLRAGYGRRSCRNENSRSQSTSPSRRPRRSPALDPAVQPAGRLVRRGERENQKRRLGL